MNPFIVRLIPMAIICGAFCIIIVCTGFGLGMWSGIKRGLKESKKPDKEDKA